MPRSVLRVGTRSTALALAQAESVRRAISTIITHRNFELVPVVTAGDRVNDDQPPPSRASYVVDIQEALASGKIDLAVHNAENLPPTVPHGVSLGAVPKRSDPRDAIVSRTGGGLAQQPVGARVGVSSLGAAAQLAAVGRGLVAEQMHGGLDVRLRALSDGAMNALVANVASLQRLNRMDRAAEVLPLDVMLPVPGQGLLAVECRSSDKLLRGALAQLEDADSRASFEAERSFMLTLSGGRDIPIAALAEVMGESVRIRGLVGTLDGRAILSDQISGADAEKVGIELADRLRGLGADAVIGRA